jgi:hypothetical protein
MYRANELFVIVLLWSAEGRVWTAVLERLNLVAAGD